MFSIYVIIFIIVILQYIYAIFALSQLAYLKISIKKYILLNLFIVLIFFIGSTVFLLIYKKQIKERKREFFKNNNIQKKEIKENQIQTSSQENVLKKDDNK